MIDKIKTSQERTKESMLGGLASDMEGLSTTKLIKTNQKVNNKGSFSEVIKVDSAGLLAKVVKKLAKRGKHSKGEETLIKALKKVELSIKQKKGIPEASNKFILAKLSSIKSTSEKSSKLSSVSGDIVEVNHLPLRGADKRLPLKGTTRSPLSLPPNLTDRGGLNTLLALLANIIQKAKPLVRLKKVRVAGITHQKPIPLTKKQAETEAIKRILINATTRSEKSASVRLAKEFEEIYNLSLSNKTLTEIRELHKAADANKANLGLK